ncbi:TonB-dependent siderophore receptor [Halomonas sp. HL-93]|uniref:TonB-dependent siderophore receptor n=1 Tax=Halomonas sp. HL-93 TaxID=1666906 RepID=UPI0006DB99C7|nr:TonB-dependent siderophore receptor [Halomonas sp. HL-93]KPQ20268.1 MAG: TonB-dependent Fe3+-hydroxamate receptor FhuA [Halomonas sp. HL-93]SBR45160.1 iron complex outermembrane recepter protein [Halomonas sp. HL-93]
MPISLCRFRPSLLVISVAMASGSAPFTFAQSSNDETLATVTVTAQQAATKVETPSIETPQSVSTVTRNDMDKRGISTVQRATDYTPGVYSNQVGASNRFDYLVLRGFSDGSLSNTFLDGLKLIGDTNSHSSLRVDPWFLDSIEVVKGPASVLYGQASPGGVVAMNSKRPDFQSGGELRFRVGNNNQRSAAFDLTGPLGEEQRVAYRLVGIASAADTQFGPTEEERYAIAPSLTWDISDDTSLTLDAYLQDEPEGGYHSGVPYEGAVEARNGRKISNTFFDGEEGYDAYDRTQRMVGYALEHRFNDQWQARQQLRYLNSDVTLNQVYGFGWEAPDSDQLLRYYSGSEESLDAWTVDNQLEANLNDGFMEHTVLAGVDYQQRDNDVSWPSGAFPSLDAFNPTYGAEPTAMYPPTNERHELEQTGVYLQDQIALDNWRFTLGGRYDWVDIRNTNQDSGQASALDDTQFSGRAGAVYLFENGVAPYLSYSTAFTPTSFVDADGDLLAPMEGEQWETGVKYQPSDSDSQYSASLFHISQENVATKEQPNDPYRAVGEIESQGIELEARTQLTDALSLQAGYSFTDITYAKSDDGNEGNNAIYSPRHQVQLWTQYAFNDGWLSGADIGAGVRHFADIAADRANTERVPDYTLVDATLGYDLSEVGMQGVETRLNASNLLDEDYVASCNSLEYCYFGAERGITASVHYRF